MGRHFGVQESITPHLRRLTHHSPATIYTAGRRLTVHIHGNFPFSPLHFNSQRACQPRFNLSVSLYPFHVYKVSHCFLVSQHFAPIITTMDSDELSQGLMQYSRELSSYTREQLLSVKRSIELRATHSSSSSMASTSSAVLRDASHKAVDGHPRPPRSHPPRRSRGRHSTQPLRDSDKDHDSDEAEGQSSTEDVRSREAVDGHRD